MVFVRGQGIVLSEPSVVAVDNETGNVVAVGSAAKDMIGRTPSDIAVTQPLKSGVIADFEVTQQMLSYFIGQTRSIGSFHRYLSRPRVVVCVPSGVTKVELRAVREAGNDMDAAISAYVQREHKLSVGTQTAEQLKIEIGSALPLPEETAAEIRGRDHVTGLPKTVVISSEEVREAISTPLNAIVAAVMDTFDRTPPELASDIMDVGMVLAGGGALLRRLDELLREETGVPVHVAEEPLACVAEGSGRFLEEVGLYQVVLPSE